MFLTELLLVICKMLQIKLKNKGKYCNIMVGLCRGKANPLSNIASGTKIKIIFLEENITYIAKF